MSQPICNSPLEKLVEYTLEDILLVLFSKKAIYLLCFTYLNLDDHARSQNAPFGTPPLQELVTLRGYGRQAHHRIHLVVASSRNDAHLLIRGSDRQASHPVATMIYARSILVDVKVLGLLVEV